MDDVVVASACRSAIGAFGGTLKDVPPYALAAGVIREAVARAGVEPEAVDDVRLGSCFEPYLTKSVARSAAIAAGIPVTATAVSMDRVCVSAMEAVVSGMAMIQAGLADVIVAGGVEVMSGVPYAIPSARWGARLQNQTIDDIFSEGPTCRLHPGPRLRRCSDGGGRRERARRKRTALLPGRWGRPSDAGGPPAHRGGAER